MEIAQSPIGEHLRDTFLQLPRLALQECGVAAQTLGALYLLCGDNRETFASRKVIAELACRPVRCVDRDLEKLIQHKWLIKRGRQRFSKNSHKVRRTHTHMLSAKAEKNRKPYLQAPRWACQFLPTWSERVVFAAIVTRHLLIEHLAIEDNHGREAYSLEALAKDTGLSVRSVHEAKWKLAYRKYIFVDGEEKYRDDCGRVFTPADEVRVNTELKLRIPTREPSCKSGNPSKGKDTPHRPAKVATTPCKSGNTPYAKVATPPCKSGNRNDRALIQTLSKNTDNEHVNGAAEPASVDVSRFRSSDFDEEDSEKCNLHRPDNQTLDAELPRRQQEYLEKLKALRESNGYCPSKK